MEHASMKTDIIGLAVAAAVTLLLGAPCVAGTESGEQERKGGATVKKLDGLAYRDRCFTSAYNDENYLYSGVLTNPEDIPTDWRELGAGALGFLNMFVVEPGPALSDSDAVKQALQFAVNFYDDPTDWAAVGKVEGIQQFYTYWVNALTNADDTSATGAAVTARVWAECRTQAAAFLREANERTGKRHDRQFQIAVAQYQIVSEQLQQVSRLFPYLDPNIIKDGKQQMQQHLDDPVRRGKAAAAVRKAAEAEKAGIEALLGIVGTM